MKLTPKALACFATALLLIMLGIVLSLWSFRQIENAAQLCKLTFATLHDAQGLLSELKDAETGQRGYLLTNNESFLEPYEAVRNTIDDRLKQLRRASLDSAAQAQLDALPPLIDAKMAELAQTIELHRKQQVEAALAIVSNGRGKQLMSDIRVRIGDFKRIESKILEHSDARFQSDMHRMLSVIVAANLILFLSALSFIWLIHRNMQQQVRNQLHFDTLNSALLANTSERAKADAERLAEALFSRQLMEQLPIGVALRTVSGDFIETNLAFADILGLPREQIVGMTNAQTTVEKYKDQDAAQAEILCKTGHYGPYEKQYLLPDGRLVPVRLRGRLVEKNGETLILSVAEDISEKRKSEFQLAQAQKMDAIGQLTGGLAHDFNNMLGVIIGNLDLLNDDLSGDSSARTKVVTALTAALRGADLTRALLAVARAQAVVSEAVDLNARLSELLPLLRHTAGPNIDISMALAAGSVMVQIDSGGLAGTLLNLVINARDAMPAGGCLTLTTCVRAVTPGNGIAILAPGQYAELSVTDTGSGMSPDVMASAMLPFFTTKKRGRGTGLGLAMAHGFVKQCGGELLLSSEAGHGTSVKLILPLAEAIIVGATQTAVELDAKALPRGSERVLVVDDEIELLAVTASWLKKLGYDVTPCTSAVSALAALGAAEAAGQPYALMISDVIMPVMDGFALAHAARTHHPDLALLHVSGFADEADRGNTFSAGDILEKPFRQAALAERVRSTLDRQFEQAQHT